MAAGLVLSGTSLASALLLHGVAALRLTESCPGGLSLGLCMHVRTARGVQLDDEMVRPVGSESVLDPVRVVPITADRKLAHCVVAVSCAASSEQVNQANVAGFIVMCVASAVAGTWPAGPGTCAAGCGVVLCWCGAVLVWCCAGVVWCFAGVVWCGVVLCWCGVVLVCPLVAWCACGACMPVCARTCVYVCV